jgi:hypothetical protein
MLSLDQTNRFLPFPISETAEQEREGGGEREKVEVYD